MRRNANTALTKRALRSSGASVRQLRVGETMRRILAEALSRDNLPHPDLHRFHITITEVRVSSDLRNASVFLLPFGGEIGDEAAQTALEILEQIVAFCVRNLVLGCVSNVLHL